MKRMKLIFPLMFIIALAGSAFSRQSTATKSRFVQAYYQDPWLDNCNSTQLVDGKCVVDPVGYICQENVLGLGPQDMYQSMIPSLCYQPYYSYTP
jgi:hypothetical protein